MTIFNFTNDEVVKRFRLVMFGTIIFDILNTLIGQPNSFWHNAQTAIRGDGLSINNTTNHMFMLFLGSGWQAYLLACVIYLSAIFFLVSILPRKVALITIFALIFGHYFDTANWLAVRWHLGMQGPFFYGLALSATLVFSAFPANKFGRRIKILRWIMLFAMVADTTVTLIGQPNGYWHHFEMVDEGNIVSRFFLTQGWYAYLIEQAVICFVVYRLTSVLSIRGGIIIALCFTFAGFTGTSNWFFYRWIWGIQAPVIFGAALASAIVLLSFPTEIKIEQTTVSSADQEIGYERDTKKNWCRC